MDKEFLKNLGIPKESLGIPEESLGIPKESLGIPSIPFSGFKKFRGPGALYRGPRARGVTSVWSARTDMCDVGGFQP